MEPVAKGRKQNNFTAEGIGRLKRSTRPKKFIQKFATLLQDTGKKIK